MTIFPSGDPAGYVGPYVSCTAGVWSAHPLSAATVGTPVADGAGGLVRRASVRPGCGLGPAGTDVTPGGVSNVD